MLLGRRTLALSIAAVLLLLFIPSSAGALTIASPTLPQLTDVSHLSPTHMNITISGTTHVMIETSTNGTAQVMPTEQKLTISTTQSTSPFPVLNPETLLATNQAFQLLSKITPHPTTPPTLTPTPTKTSSISISSPTPTHTFTRVFTPTPTPTIKITLTPTRFFITPTRTAPTPTQPQPTAPTSSNASLDDKQQFIMNAINDYRHQNGLSDVHAESYTCNFAKTRAQEIVGNFNHDGFTNRMNSKTLPYPSYSQITENIAMTSDYKQVVPMWIASPGHAENMRRDTPNVCVAQSGDYFAYEGWKP